MKTRSFLLLAVYVALGIVVLCGSAHAVELNNWNVTELNASGDSVHVEVNGDVITVQWMSGGGDGPQAIGIDKFFYDNGDGSPVHETIGIAGNTDRWKFNFGGENASGFGDFASKQSNGGGETGGFSEPLIFTLEGDEPIPLDFAVHVRYDNGCSGWVSNRSTTSIDSDSNCVAVPEPATLLLLGSGLVGIAFWGRRKSQVPET